FNIPDSESKFVSVKGDITEIDLLDKLCKGYKPDIIIHCAGIAHQRFSSVNLDEYHLVNSYATENLAKAAIKANPDVYFMFLSSISVYGEDRIKGIVSENDVCNPSSDYAKSKLDAEKRLIKLYDAGLLKKLDILRLAPVYDSEWALNLDRRVFAFKKLAYIKFGSGEQEMSAVSRQNLVDFIKYRVNQAKDSTQDNSHYNIFNVCDHEPYKFTEIIRVFKRSEHQPDRLVLCIPLVFVWFASRFAGLVLKNKQDWIYSCYDKLAGSLIFDNKKMLETGFNPKYDLESVFLESK
ncbi:MAG: NAD-dependent epimerase/dehydratase family protein, partial [Desulfobacteraceae bacterium]|nr:NAD-dependent epimerase/dehydratase family protein [Desulfobacteraceae bacterium]